MMTTTIRAALAALALAAPAAAETTHTVVPGDHLWGLAGHYYKNNFRWKAIYAANQQKIKDPHWIYPGQVFVIPDLPGAEIGELPARPVAKEEAAAPVAAEPAPVPAPPAVRAEAEPPPALTDDLSVNMPEGMAGQYPSMTRRKAPEGWKEDGVVAEFEGREMIAAEGDWVQAKLERSAPVGEKFEVLRRVAAQELDDDKKAVYLQRVGLVQVKAATGGEFYRLQILKSGDTVQVGDLLKRESYQ